MLGSWVSGDGDAAAVSDEIYGAASVVAGVGAGFEAGAGAGLEGSEGTGSGSGCLSIDCAAGAFSSVLIGQHVFAGTRKDSKSYH